MRVSEERAGQFWTRLRDRWLYGVASGLLLFVFDWMGYNKWEPDLFFPKPLSEVYWHLPVEVGICVIAVVIVPRTWL